MERLKTSILAAALVLTGCVYSVNPLYTVADLKTDPDLVGTWAKNEADKNTWKFEEGGDSSYKLTVTEGETSSPFVAHLVQIGGHRFLDISPDKSGLEQLKQAELYKAGLIRGHLFAKIAQTKPTLQMAVLDDDWLSKLLKKEPSALAHQERAEGGILLTASTKALQTFVIKHWDTPGAWGEKPTDLRRK